MEITSRITLNPEVCHGRPAIRNMRFTVAQMLELLAGGMTESELLDDYPFLEAEDIRACLAWAARMAQAQSVFPAPVNEAA